MSNIPHAAGDLVVVLVQHPKQITADVAAGVHKVPCPVKGTVVRVQSIAGIQGGTTPVTDLDITPKKNTTSLCSAVLAAVDSSVADEDVEGTLSATAADLACDVGDYFTCGYDITGGSSPTIDGAGVLITIARRD